MIDTIIAYSIKIITLIIITYLIGSIPTGYIIVKLFKNMDIREVASGSTGATNVKRVMGTKWFFTVMFLDALKGAIAVFIALKWFNFIDFRGLGPSIGALFVTIGHSKSVFLKFTGGKSVATGIGTILAMCWPVGLIMATLWGIITYATKYVSLGSIIAVSIGPILMNAFEQNIYYICYTAICAIYVIIRHKDNIKRLAQGNENKIRE